MPPIVRTEALTSGRFAPFGTVLESPKAMRQDFAAEVVSSRTSAKANLALLRVESLNPPFIICQMERHRFSTQTFFPLKLDRYLVVVCQATSRGEPDLGSVLAFEGSSGQVVQYAPGTWHAAIRAIGRDATFAMLIHEDGTVEDCDTCDVNPFEVAFGT